MTEPLKFTPLHRDHKNLGAKLVPFAGWEMPVLYSGIVREHQAVRQAAGLFDVCHMGELELSGPDAARVANQLVTNDLDRIEPGQAMYTCCCNERGTVLDDLILYKRSETSVLVVCNASNRDKISAVFRARASASCSVDDVSDATGLIALQGPQAFAVLARAGRPELESELGRFRFTDVLIGSVACTIARTGYTGEDGVELFCKAHDAPALWRHLLEAGAPLGLEPCGLGARDTLRLEARLPLYGNDIDETTNPLEAGLGIFVKLDGADFVGKEALLEVKGRGPARRLVGFEMVGKGVARHGYPVLDLQGKPVGTCTSGSPSPTLGKAIGLCYLPTEMSNVGQEFLVDCRGKAIAARVVKTPFYKRPAPR
ncbi:MAG TPA: glycine cleavage system aminomethyltransferase GcvT [Polyangiaceae bacterium]|nr:glycine cleavage system aminomethyltransferase GcvT [Polyangiaceae bacterium]